jgi:putative Holliday junction resolvase
VRFLGIDYGRRRIGLALSDPSGMLARPWKTIQGRPTPGATVEMLVSEVNSLIAEDDGLAGVVLGYPRRLGGEPTDQTAAVTVVGETLSARLSIPVTFQDERLTSREAESLLARRHKDWRARKSLLDAASAAIILQDYLDERSPIVPAEDQHS